MKAKIRFIIKPIFNLPNNCVAVPGLLVGRAEERRGWTLCFRSEQQVSELVYIGDLQWAIAPIEQDFGKGVRFTLMSEPTLFADGPSTQGVLAEGELLG